MRAATITAGTDEPEGMFLHAELLSYVRFGMTPYEALRTATVNPAELLNLDAGSIEPGKLADIVLVQGNPLENIHNTNNVKHVILNGRHFTIEDLLSGKAKDAPALAHRAGLNKKPAGCARGIFFSFATQCAPAAANGSVGAIGKDDICCDREGYR